MDLEDSSWLLPEEIIITILEFCDVETLLLCHVLCGDLLLNLTKTHNCYRLWYSLYCREIENVETRRFDNYVKGRLSDEFRKNVKDHVHWKRKFIERKMLQKSKWKSREIFRCSGELWFVSFSNNGKYILCGGENNFRVYLVTQSDFKKCKLIKEGLNIDCVAGNFSPNGESFFVMTTFSQPPHHNGTILIFNINDDLTLDSRNEKYLNMDLNEELLNFNSTKRRMKLEYIRYDKLSLKNQKRHKKRKKKKKKRKSVNEASLEIEQYFAISRPTVMFSITPFYLSNDYFIFNDMKDYFFTFVICKFHNYDHPHSKQSLKNQVSFTISLELDTRLFIRKFETKTKKKSHIGLLEDIRISTLCLEETKKESCMVAFNSEVDLLIDTYDTVIFFEIPSIEYLIEIDCDESYEKSDLKMSGQDDFFGSRYNLVRNVTYKLSEMDFLYLNGAISEHVWINDLAYFLVRPWDGQEVSKYYQVFLYRIEEIEESEEHIFIRRRKLEKIRELAPSMPCLSNRTLWFSISVSSNVIVVGSEVGSYLYDSTTFSFITHKKRKNPVSSVTFHPQFRSVFGEAGDDGSLLISWIRGFNRLIDQSREEKEEEEEDIDNNIVSITKEGKKKGKRRFFFFK